MNKPREDISVSSSVFTKLWDASYSFGSQTSHYVAGSTLDEKSVEPRRARYWQAVRKMTTPGDDRQVILIVELTASGRGLADYVSWARFAKACDCLASDIHVACEGIVFGTPAMYDDDLRSYTESTCAEKEARRLLTP